MGKIRVKSLIRGDKIGEGSRKRATIQQVNEIESILRGGNRADNTLPNIASRGDTDKHHTARGKGFRGKGGGIIIVKPKMETTITDKVGKGSATARVSSSR